MSSLEILNMLNQKSQHQEYDIGKKGKQFHNSGSMIHQCNCIKINTNKNVFYTFFYINQGSNNPVLMHFDHINSNY